MSKAGLLVGPFIAVATFTGLVYAFAPTIEEVVYHDAYTATSNHPARPLDEQVQAAWKMHPELPLSGVQRSDDPTKTTRVLFQDPSLPSSSYRQAVFVDPGDLDIKGDMTQYGSSNASPLRAWLSEGHRRLWLDDAGRWYSELAASWLGAIAVAGLLLTLRSRPSKRRGAVWHRRLGLWLIPGMLFLTFTGLTWSGIAGENIGELRKQLQWTAPTTAASPVPAGVVMDVQGVMDAARADGPTGLIEAKPGAQPTDSWVVQEARAPYRLDLDKVTINPVTERVEERVPFSDWPLPAKITEWLINLHMGFLFGIWSELALGLLAAGILMVVTLGYYLWFKAIRAGRSWVPARGALSWWGVLILLAYSMLAPLFGGSLLLFFAVELLLSWRGRLSRQRKA
ncbi:PepSY-associated TM helix domain-containing protein [Corynebacterium epidermidicanis]|uniref:Putative iron-regulated membrane protein n=1 Tax=Corynebacterium epidermidicanis TaxID=1050174 RepID=A0A0G3GUV5_9CORY|nr:PepSY domain-containing protein [Corynebacterium epidermidicanis]AKK04300.1 putative iron-regulated membrane protein [Corynebacterium epidermidicanis]